MVCCRFKGYITSCLLDPRKYDPVSNMQFVEQLGLTPQTAPCCGEASSIASPPVQTVNTHCLDSCGSNLTIGFFCFAPANAGDAINPTTRLCFVAE